MRHAKLGGILCILAMYGLTTCCIGATEDSGELGPPFELDLTAPGSRTAVDYRHESAPPWPSGNDVSIGGRNLVNIHDENLAYLRKKLGLTSLVVRAIDESRLLVVDERIDRKWLLFSPQLGSLEQRLTLLNRHRAYFAELPAKLKELIGEDWELVDHQVNNAWHPDGVPSDYMTLMLPSHRVEFREAGVVCKDDTGDTVAERPWLIGVEGDTAHITLCAENEPSRGYIALRATLEESDGKLILIPTWWLSETGQMWIGHNLQGNVSNDRLIFRRITERP